MACMHCECMHGVHVVYMSHACILRIMYMLHGVHVECMLCTCCMHGVHVECVLCTCCMHDVHVECSYVHVACMFNHVPYMRDTCMLQAQISLSDNMHLTCIHVTCILHACKMSRIHACYMKHACMSMQPARNMRYKDCMFLPILCM